MNYTYLKDKLSSFDKLDKNWDGYNAESIDLKVILKAFDFLCYLEYSNIVDNIKINVFPMNDGGIQFEFDGKLESELEINSELILTFKVFDNESNLILQKTINSYNEIVNKIKELNL